MSRAIRKRPEGVVVKRSFAGKGLFATRPYKKGERVIEYVGRAVSEAESYTSRSKYLFKISEKRTIDGPPRVNIAGYINHSCRPNCEVTVWRGHIYIKARRAIKPGEELAYDYGEEYLDAYITPRGCRCPKCAKPRVRPVRRR